MKNIIIILTFATLIGCYRNSKQKTNQSNVNIIEHADENKHSLITEEIEKNGNTQEIVDREIHLYSKVLGNKYKDKDTTYSIIATYLGASFMIIIISLLKERMAHILIFLMARIISATSHLIIMMPK